MLKKYIKNKKYLYNFLKKLKNFFNKFIGLIEGFLFKLLLEGSTKKNIFTLTENQFIDKFTKKETIPRFFIDPNQKEEGAQLISDSEKGVILNEANNICSHNFQILGKAIHFDSEIDWHLDPNSGFRWPLFYYKRLLPVFNTTDNTDGKYPYELSRLNHITILGMAYWITRDEKYCEEFIKEVESWIDKNPYCYGINWTCTMDVAIRVCNLITGLYFFILSENITQDFLIKLLKTCYQHGEFIVKNLENRGPFTSNHYIADLIGLIYIGTLFPEFKKIKRWKEFATKELISEMQKQVYEDGCDFEASTCYHRLVLEFFFFGTLLIVINHNKFSGVNHKEICEEVFGKEYTEKLQKMFKVVLYLLKPNGKMPQIGDNDSGRLHLFGKREVLDMRYLLAFAAIFFKESEFKIREFDFSEYAFWVFGAEGKRIYDNLPFRQEPLKSKAFPDVGWYIMRHNKDYCFISCGPNGQNGNGGHAHNDKLSFELVLDGDDIVVDPGTYVYTPYPDWRNKFRSTSFHNTIQIDKLEQNDISHNIFGMKCGIHCNVLEFKEDIEKIIFEGSVNYLNYPFIHNRKIILCKNKDFIEITDNVSAKGEHQISLNFSLGNKIVNSIFKSEKNTLKEFLGHYSSEYGKKESVIFLKYRVTMQDNFMDKINIYKKREVKNEAGLSEKRISSGR